VEPGDGQRQATGAGEEVIQSAEEENEVYDPLESSAESERQIKEKGDSPVQVTAGPLMFVRIWQRRQDKGGSPAHDRLRERVMVALPSPAESDRNGGSPEGCLDHLY
jgi:hypothetical protein